MYETGKRISYVALAAPAAGFGGAEGAPVALAAPGFADIVPLERISNKILGMRAACWFVVME